MAPPRRQLAHGKACNAPLQRPPQNVTLPPSTYMDEKALTSVVDRSTPCLAAPKHPGEAHLQTDTKAIPAEQTDTKTMLAEKACDKTTDAAPFVSESSKFSKDEQSRLLELRCRLSSCSTHLTGLIAMVNGDNCTASGLPRLRETDRACIGGCSYSVEDAQKDICPDFYVQKMRQYVSYIDHALADDLEAEELHSNSVELFPPLCQMHRARNDLKVSGWTQQWTARADAAEAYDQNAATCQRIDTKVMGLSSFTMPHPFGIG